MPRPQSFLGRHLTVKYCWRQENSPSWKLSSRGGAQRVTGRGGNADHAHTRQRWPELVASSGFPGGSNSKESACNVGDLGSIPGLGRSPGGRNGNPLQHPCLQNPIKEPGAGRGQGGRMHPAARPAAFQVTASSSIPTMLFQIPYLLKGNER